MSRRGIALCRLLRKPIHSALVLYVGAYPMGGERLLSDDPGLSGS
jgi:hypothetical protein